MSSRFLAPPATVGQAPVATPAEWGAMVTRLKPPWQRRPGEGAKSA